MPEHTPRQLLLGITLDNDATFANYYAAENHQLLEYLHNFVSASEPHLIFLWGSKASGKTHLLQAACHQAASLRLDSIYLPLAERSQLAPQIFEGLESLQLVCLDDLQGVAGDKDWEMALFRLINQTRETGTVIVMSADRPVLQLDVNLPDLYSRLQSSTVFSVQNLDDDGKLALLTLRARRLGIELEPQVARFILLRAGRSLYDLLAVLGQLDTHSLVEKRPITIPLVKTVMGW
ncbi:MAG: DnaA regulatory inactivator Hda [Pseudohongiellaceae bacterium]